MSKIPVNSPCPCGSGKKYKKCHGDPPPFFGNKLDDRHCLQASLLMALLALKHRKDWDFIDELTQYEPGLWTWNAVAVVGLNQIVRGTLLYSVMDFEKFSKQGEEYFREHNLNDPKWFDTQKSFASPGFKKEQEAARVLVSSGHFRKHELMLPEIEQLLDTHFIIAMVDVGALLGEDFNAISHSTLVYGTLGGHFMLHDPGLPPKPEWFVPKSTFMRAFKKEAIVIPRAIKNATQ